MNKVLKCLWSSITSTLWVSIVLLISVSIVIWVIFAVQICTDWRFCCNFDETLCENINQLLLNLSYSYIAGYLFYLFTCWLPSLLRSIKMQPILDAGKKDIKVCIHNMYSFFHDVDEGDINMNDIDEICKVMSEANWTEIVHSHLPDSNRMRLLAHFSRELNSTLIDFLTLNKEFLSTDDLMKLNVIRHTNPYYVYGVMEKVVVNQDNCSPIVDRFRQLLLEAKVYFGDLNI